MYKPLDNAAIPLVWRVAAANAALAYANALADPSATPGEVAEIHAALRAVTSTIKQCLLD